MICDVIAAVGLFAVAAMIHVAAGVSRGDAY